jgi:dipeptidyl aminopeptidase/acylaminoacyl peptidase
MTQTAIALFLLAVWQQVQAQNDRRPLAEDIVSFSRASGLCITHDGEKVAYLLSLTSYDSLAKPSGSDPGWKTERQIYVVPAAGGEPKRLTNGSNASAPAWSPDGRRIAFIRNAGGKPGIHIIPIDGGEAEMVGTGGLDPGPPAWSPDGKLLAFTAEVPETKEEAEGAWREGGADEFDHQWRSSQLWTVPLEGGSPHRITVGNEHVVDFAWSPDGKRFAVVLAASADPYVVFSLVTCKILSAIDGSIIESVQDTPRAITGLQWSPDGMYLAFATNEKSLSLLNCLRVHQVGATGSWSATSSLDLTLTGFVWTNDSRSIIVHVSEKTTSVLYKIPVRGGKLTNLGFSGRSISGDIHLDRKERGLTFMSSTYHNPPDPTAFHLQTHTSRIIVRLNPEVDRWSGIRQEVIRWKNADGIEIEGLLSTPDPLPVQPVPLIVDPHGGPDGVSDCGFDFRARYFVAQGFSVFMPNYRGSLGYGYEFYASNRGRLGEVEFADIESGVDHLISVGKADPRRLLYGGWSWGGYTTAWTIGHTSRYRAAVIGAGVADVISAYVNSDINHGVAAQWEYKGDPWRQTENFDRASPFRYLKNAVTPTLIIHGRNDTRVEFAQGLTLYRALSDIGCETKFLVYPRESHGFREPAHTIHYLKAWVDWYKKHLVP